MNGSQFSVFRKMLVLCILLVLFAAAFFVVYKTMIQANPAEEWLAMNENMQQTLKELDDAQDGVSEEKNSAPAGLGRKNGNAESADKGQKKAEPNEAAVSADAPLDLNLATAEQLDKLPYIGPSKAQAIIAWRSQNGSFRNIDDVMKVKGIGPKIFEKIKAFIAVKKK